MDTDVSDLVQLSYQGYRDPMSTWTDSSYFLAICLNPAEPLGNTKTEIVIGLGQQESKTQFGSALCNLPQGQRWDRFSKLSLFQKYVVCFFLCRIRAQYSFSSQCLSVAVISLQNQN